MTTNIISTVTVAGIHRWLGANEAEYSYLKSYHRHEFEIEAHKRVNHNDRDIEIIQFSRYLKEYLYGYYDGTIKMCNFGEQSCEHLAHQLVAAFGLEYCSVKEDGKMGAVVQLRDHENFAIVGKTNSGKSTLAEMWYSDWNIIEVGEIVKELVGQGLFEEKDKRVLRPELANEIAHAVKMRLKDSPRSVVVGIRQNEIIRQLPLTNVIGLDGQFGNADINGDAIDRKLGLMDIQLNVLLPWVSRREDAS